MNNNNTFVKIERCSEHYGIQYVIVFTQAGYRRCYMGLPFERIKMFEDRFLDIECERRLEYGNVLFRKQIDSLVFPEEIFWYSFSYNDPNLDKPSLETTIKYYGKDIPSQMKESIKEKQYASNKASHKQFVYCVEQCKRVCLLMNRKYNELKAFGLI